jgi:riboflavin synthase
MFTGLVESYGTVLARAPRGAVVQMTIAAPTLAARLKTGDSISVNGVCLTAIDIDAIAAVPYFTADLAAETIARTTLSRLAIGTRVNLEMPTPAGTPLGGHVVQGHVDGVGRLVALEPVGGRKISTGVLKNESDEKFSVGDTDWRLEIALPGPLMRYVVEKGSISVDGTSLTVAAVEGERIGIAILPHTYRVTNLHTLAAGDEVNIEVDALARYAEQLRHAEKENSLSLAELVAKGF